jgi:spoIIIJ-associated protein
MTMNESEEQVEDNWDDEADDDGDLLEHDGDSDEGDGDEDDGGNGAAEASGDDRPNRNRGGRRRRGNGAREEAYEPTDERSKMCLDFVTKVIDEMGMDCSVHMRRPRQSEDDSEIHIEITGPDAGRVIGKKGQVLAALQFLTHRVINRPGTDKRHVLVDAEGYRTRRDSQLSTMAKRLGKQAMEQGKIITFEPMSPRDRRVVHMALAKFDGVVTKSDGEGDDRRVQIIPVRRSEATS